MATFQVCDTNADDGLNLEEIKQDGCKEVLQNLFGLSTDVLQDTFFHLDENMDKIISREEGYTASQSLERSDPVNTVKDTVKDTIKDTVNTVKDTVNTVKDTADKLTGKIEKMYYMN